jgi:hypothetical protein
MGAPGRGLVSRCPLNLGTRLPGSWSGNGKKGMAPIPLMRVNGAAGGRFNQTLQKDFAGAEPFTSQVRTHKVKPEKRGVTQHRNENASWRIDLETKFENDVRDHVCKNLGNE